MSQLPIETLSSRIREAMRRAGVDPDAKPGGVTVGTRSLSWLADQANVPKSVLGKYKAGKRDDGDFMDGIRLLQSLARVCGVEFSWLATGEGPVSGRPQLTEEELDAQIWRRARALAETMRAEEREPAATPPSERSRRGR